MLPSNTGSCFFPGDRTDAGLYHIAAISPNFNRIHYAIECFVALIFIDPSHPFRKDAEPCRVRLDPLIADESQAGPASIELLLHGRWKTACKGIRRRQLVRVESASVTEANDQELHAHQLELVDPIVNGERAAQTRIYFLNQNENDFTRRIMVATYNQLEQGMVPYSVSDSNTRHRSPILPNHCLHEFSNISGNGRLHVSHSRKSPDRKHSYAPSIRHLWDIAQSEKSNFSNLRVNVYGVILEARAPCITKGPDLRSEVVIADPSSFENSTDFSTMKTLVLHRFEPLPQDAIPFRSVGDVVRAHRVDIKMYNDVKSGSSILQGAGKFYSTYVLWAGDSSDYDPIAALDPVRSASGKERPEHIEHTITDDDKLRVRKLREWGSNLLKSLPATSRPFMNTLHAAWSMFRSNTLRQPFDLVCHFECIPVKSTCMRFLVSDGFDRQPQRHFRVVVEGCPVFRESNDPVAFDFFAPSWRLRPCRGPMWLLIRDARIRMGLNGEFLIALTAGERTSTILWLQDDTPEVRYFSMNRASAGHQVFFYDLPSSSLVRNGDSRTANITFPVDEGLGGGRASQSERRANARASVKSAFSTGVTCLLNPSRVITATSNAKKPPTSLTFVREKALALGASAPPFRVLVRARAWKYPNDLCLACRPWCQKCARYIEIQSTSDCVLKCPSCSMDAVSSNGDEICWTYKVQIVMEDEAGSMMDAWICDRDGATFFGKASPCDLSSASNSCARTTFYQYVCALLEPHNWMDCSVKPYAYTTDMGIPAVECKIFATMILPYALNERQDQ